MEENNTPVTETSTPVTETGTPVTENNTPVIPEQNKPLSPWAYFGYQILFAIPVIGFIFLIIYSVNNTNINRRNFARSYWCVFVLMIILVIICAVAGVSALSSLSGLFNGMMR